MKVVNYNKYRDVIRLRLDDGSLSIPAVIGDVGLAKCGKAYQTVGKQIAVYIFKELDATQRHAALTSLVENGTSSVRFLEISKHISSLDSGEELEFIEKKNKSTQ